MAVVVVGSGNAEAQAKSWDTMSADGVNKTINLDGMTDDWKVMQKQLLAEPCDIYMKSDAYSSGNTTHPGYKICCEFAERCAFYKQTWFYLACGGGALLIIIILILICVCCCCKGRSGGGKGEIESIDEEN